MKPQTLFLAILSFFTPLTLNAQVLEQDSLALVAFYNSTGGPNWYDNSNWLTGPVSTWYGVTVEGERVTELIINSNNLAGVLPVEMGQLSALKSLGMSNDQQLTGEIPISLFQIPTLERFGIGNCSNLVEFSLPQNQLTGPIPPEIGNLDFLRMMDLNDNQLTGSIPGELGNCDSLTELKLNNNLLTGTIPEGLANISRWNEFDFSHNQLEGDMPGVFGQVEFYVALRLNDNRLTGIPPWEGGHWLLDLLDIKNNRMTFEDIEPHFVGYWYFYYAPQDSMEVEIDTLLPEGSNYSIYSGTGGEFTTYRWYLNGDLIEESTTADTLFLENISAADTGTYTCEATNSEAEELTLYRRPVRIGLDTGSSIQTTHKELPCIIYPIPVSDKLRIRCDCDQTLDVTICDARGKVWLDKILKPAGCTVEVNIDHLPVGVYLLKIETDNFFQTAKLIKI
ncbi:MAG: T9SS type A sorting domain-containing protein [Bacteroidales bacterium]|nr:T9SS type A sorting domain-containing protein [Bacteroidales bacterium]MCF8377419.1 T9SS type A sorting domain-containing protein [Bacteroidales bacterium]